MWRIGPTRSSYSYKEPPMTYRLLSPLRASGVSRMTKLSAETPFGYAFVVLNGCARMRSCAPLVMMTKAFRRS